MFKRSRNADPYSDRPDLESPDVLHPAVRYASQLPLLDAQYPRASCWEMCGRCETEFLMHAYRPEPCPECGYAVLPCNMCDQETVDCRECPYKGISGKRLGGGRPRANRRRL